MRARVAVLVASLAAAPVSWPVAADGSPQLRTSPSKDPGLTAPDLTSRTPGIAPTPAWDTFSADVTIRRRMVRKDGTPGPEAPEMRYRWVRSLGDGGWKTTMTVLSVSSDTIQTSKGARTVPRTSPISRIEIGDARTPARVYDGLGRLMFMTPTNPRPAADTEALAAIASRFGGGAAARVRSATTIADAAMATMDGPIRAEEDLQSRQWVDQFMPSLAGRDGRRAALAREMGSPQGMVRGLERFVSHADDLTTEILSDSAWAVPVEINVLRSGGLVSHAVVGYEQDPGAGLVRRRIRSEHLLSPESGDRAAADIEFTNIRLDRGGVR